MKILYITPLWSGVKPFFLDGNNTAKGMPAFFNVFQAILKKKDVSVIYILLFIYNDKSKINIPLQYSGKIKITPFYISGRFSLYTKVILSFLVGVYLVIFKRIDLIYGHGTISFIGSIIGNLLGIKNFRRIYGTFLYAKVVKKRKVICTDFFEYLSFKLKANGVIITNDGTHGDRVYKEINNNHNGLYFLLNGVNRKTLYKSIGFERDKYFSYIARIDIWKRQHLLLEALHHLKQKEIVIPKTYLIGSIYDKSYHKYLNELIEKYDLSNSVVFTGPIEAKYIPFILKNSLCTFSLYSFSNLGNVFIEAIACGSVMLAINENNSLDLFSSSTYCSVNDNPEEISNNIMELMLNESIRNQYRSKSESFSVAELQSWKNRIEVELNILFK